MPADQLCRDGLDDIREIEGALLLGHARMENDLQQKVAKLILQPGQVVARNGVSHLVSFFERVWRDGAEGLLQIPRTAASGRPQRRHDLDQPGNVAGRLHGRCVWAGSLKTDKGP